MSTQLMIWPDKDRAIPNALARSALFNVDNIRSAGQRTYLKDATIASDGCVTIKYTGEELRQDDADVWLQLVHMNRDELASNQGHRTITFTCQSMMKALGWSTTKGANGRHRLAAIIQRLLVATLNIEGPREGYAGHLVNDFTWKDRDVELREWKVNLNQKLVDLYALTYRTRIDWETRLSLSPLAKWLHCDVLSHRTPWPVSLERLHQMCGSKCKDPKEWRKLVQAAMTSLVTTGTIESFEIKAGALSWKRNGEALQGFSLP